MLHKSLCLAALLPLCYAEGEGTIPSFDFPNQQQILTTKSRPQKVAIIGAGAAGSSAAYHLRKYAEAADVPLNITIFERNSYIGGRSTTVQTYNDSSSAPLELGGSIFVSVNYILSNATQDFGLDYSSAGGDESLDSTSSTIDRPALGIWNGDSFVFTQSSSSSWWWDVAKLVYRYGFAPLRAQNLMKKTVGKFLRMYDAPVFPFESLSDTAYELGLTEATAKTGQQFLLDNNIGDKFANELVQAATRVNYAQNLPLIHGLEAVVCLATDGAKSIKGGNWQIFKNMCKAATSDVRLETEVVAIDMSTDGGYKLKSKSSNSTTASDQDATEQFDEVVIAAPYQFSNIAVSSKSIHVPDEIPYVKLHVTLFTSPHLLSPAAFKLPPDSRVPRIVLTTLQDDEEPGANPHYSAKAGFFSISTLRAVQNPKLPRKEYAYKIFSPIEVDNAFLARILGISIKALESGASLTGDDLTWIYRKVWHSYPYEYPRVTFEESRLDKGLWYTAGMDSFISTMETNALMGKNVARLIADGW